MCVLACARVRGNRCSAFSSNCVICEMGSSLPNYSSQVKLTSVAPWCVSGLRPDGRAKSASSPGEGAAISDGGLADGGQSHLAGGIATRGRHPDHWVQHDVSTGYGSVSLGFFRQEISRLDF